MARLICAGHSSCDLPFRPVDKSVFDTDTVFAEDTKVLTGGDALNSSATLAKLGLGADFKFVSIVGDDVYGRITTEYLRAHGVRTDFIRVDPAASSLVTVILIDKDNERHFVCHGDAARRLTLEDVTRQFDADTAYLHIGSFMSLDGLEGENHKRLFQYAKERGVHTSFDVTFDNEGKWLEKIQAGLAYTDLMFASYDEAVNLTGGIKDPKEIGLFFKARGVKKFVLKLGKDGCYATDFTCEYRVPTYKNRPVIDTTGAGDAFVAGYLYAMLRGLPMEACCVIGNVEGTLAVGTLGSHSGTGGVKEVKEFLRANGAFHLDAEALAAKL